MLGRQFCQNEHELRRELAARGGSSGVRPALISQMRQAICSTSTGQAALPEEEGHEPLVRGLGLDH